MKIKNRYFIYLELLFMFLVSLIPLLWFRQEHMIFGSDSGYPLDYVQYFTQRTFTWTSSQSFGEDMSTFMGALPLHGVQYVLSVIGIPYFDIQKVTLVFWFASVAYAMYFCVRYFFAKPEQWPIRIVSVLLYSINFYIFLFWTIGSQTTLSAYAFLPFFFLFTFRLINKDITPFKAALWINLFFLLYNAGGVAGFPLLGPVIVVGVCLFTYQAILNLNKEFIKSFVLFLVCSLILFIFLNAYYLLPFVLSFTQQFGNLVAKSGGVQGVLEWTKFISQFDNYSNLFRLQGDNIWYVNNDSYPRTFLTNPILVISSFVFPALAYSTLLFVKKIREKKLLFFLIPLSLVGIFLSAGSHEPLGFLYEAMIKYIPGFAAFRSAFYKFMPIVIFSFAILNGIAIYHMSQSVRAKYRSILPILLILFIFFYHYPFYDVGNFLTNNKFPTMIKIPSYIVDFTKEKPPATDKYRTLVLPPQNDNHSVEIYDWDYYSGYPVFPGVSNKSYVESNAYLNDNEKFLVKRLYGYLREYDYEIFSYEAKRLGIKYILLSKDVYYKDENGPRETPKFYQDRLENNRFNKVWEKGKWTIYEIKDDINPVVFTFDHLHGFNGSLANLPTQREANFNFYQNLTDNNQNIWTKSNITPISCTVCVEDQDVGLEINPPRVLPNSIFYPLKTFVERRSINKETDKDNSFLLGLSLKRVSELYGLTGVKRVTNNKRWLAAIGSLKSNWEKIAKILPEKSEEIDLTTLKITKQYLEFEVATLKDVYITEAVISNSLLRSELEEVIAYISNIQEKNDSEIYNLTATNTYIFTPQNPEEEKAQDIVVDYKSLLSQNGSMVYPYQVQYDNQEPIVIEAPLESSDIILPQVNQEYSRLKLFFPEVDLYTSTRKELTNTAYAKNEMCIISNVSDFKWYETYDISSKIVGEKDNLSVYIVKGKRDKSENSEFKADKTYEIKKRNITSLVASVRSNQDDKSLSIYFCSDPGRDPETAFKDIKISPKYEPILYFKENLGAATAGNVKYEFNKINPTEYIVKLKGTDKPYFLGFSERYSEHWKAFINGEELTKSHFILNGYANAWHIDKKGTYEVKIKFIQQEIFRLGLIISFYSGVILFVSLIVFYLKKVKWKE